MTKQRPNLENSPFALTHDWRSDTFEELRRIAQPPEYSPSPTDRLYRRFSIYLSVPLAKLGATPNATTVGWILIGLAGAVCLLSPVWFIRLSGALLLQFSYLLDFVDGEVARLTNRKSMVGNFLDLMGHALIKTALPLTVGGWAFLSTGWRFMLVAGAVGAVAISVGDSLRFHAVCTSGRFASGDLERVATSGQTIRGISLTKLMRGIFEASFESPGLFGFTLLATTLNQPAALSLYWMIAGPVWMCLRAADYSRRMRALEEPSNAVASDAPKSNDRN